MSRSTEAFTNSTPQSRVAAGGFLYHNGAMNWETGSAEETQRVAMDIFSEAISRNPKTPLILLSGELGAGKTTLAQALASLVCVEGSVTSPTFTIERRYSTRHDQIHQFIHLDLYRLNDAEELGPLRLEETLETPNALIVVEWPQHGNFVFPEHAVHVALAHNGGDKRHITLV